MTFKEFLQEFVNKSDAEKINIGINTGKLLRGALEDDEKFIAFMRVLTAVFSAADGSLQAVETEMYNFATGEELSGDEFFEICDQIIGDKEIIDGFFDFVDSLDYDVRIALGVYGLAVMSADDKLTKEEAQLVLRILPELVEEE